MADYNTQDVMTLEQMTARIRKSASDDSYLLVEKAYHFAEKAHEGQKRKSGEAYFVHPVCVATTLTELMIDAPTVAAGLLHDTVEDCEDVTLDTIRENFGDEVARLVDGVTKLKKLDFADKEEQQAESLRKMILAMSKDIRVVLIKLADRLHNMRTLRFQSPARQQAIARETLDIYAPLAHRLGVYSIKSELEDLSLKYLDPEGYERVAQMVGEERAERMKSIRLVIDELSNKLDETGIHYDIDGRPKHIYSIYRKMVMQNKPFEQIYDLIAIRVIVNTIPECYTVLGIVHTLWNQMPNRFKDYISVPKANMYQSLHTTVMGGRLLPMPFEVQIRTWEMHRIAEYGIAAHWRYKEGASSSDLDNKLYWLRQILDWQSETRDSKEFVNSLKTDLFSEEVFLFTPKGDIISMQRGATPLDFAYRIHSAVGNQCTGVRVNGKIVPLDTVLQTGDRVEVITSASSKGPSMDWLKIVTTQQARTKIRQYFKRERQGENIALGKEMIDRECKKRGVQMGLLVKPENYEPILNKYVFADIEDIYCAVGYGGLTAAYVVSRMLEEQHLREPPKEPELPPATPVQQEHHGKPTNSIYVNGEGGMLVRFARCCSPIPGDDIVGFITRGRGVTVHKADCANCPKGDDGRRIPVSWSESDNMGTFNAGIQIEANDHVGLLAQLAACIGDMNVPISAASARIIQKGKSSMISMMLQVTSRGQLNSLIKALENRSDVIAVHRGTGM